MKFYTDENEEEARDIQVGHNRRFYPAAILAMNELKVIKCCVPTFRPKKTELGPQTGFIISLARSEAEQLNAKKK